MGRTGLADAGGTLSPWHSRESDPPLPGDPPAPGRGETRRQLQRHPTASTGNLGAAPHMGTHVDLNDKERGEISGGLKYTFNYFYQTEF